MTGKSFAQGGFFFNQHREKETFVMSMSTTSNSATWSPDVVSKTGHTLHWEVTGAVTTGAYVNKPTFDFSTPGTKNITVTCVDGGDGLTVFYCTSNSLTSLDISGANDLTILSCFSNLLTSLDISNNTALYEFWCYSNLLTSLDVSNNTALRFLYCNSNSLSQTSVDDILCNLALIGLSNGAIEINNNAVPSSTGEACATTLEGRGWTVITD